MIDTFRRVRSFVALTATLAGFMTTSNPTNRVFGDEPRIVRGLKNPTSAVVGPGGRVYLTMLGEPDNAGDGSVVIVAESGKVTTFASGLDDPEGIVAVGDRLFVADRDQVWRIDSKGKVELFVGPEAFPRRPVRLRSLATNDEGNLLASDSGDRAGKLGAVFRIDNHRKIVMVIDGELSSPRIEVPDGVLGDDVDHLFVADSGLGNLYRVDLNTRNAQRIGGGFGSLDGLARDDQGRLFVGDGRNGRLYRIISDFEPPVLVSEAFRGLTHLAPTPGGRTLLVTNRDAGSLTWWPIR